MSTLAPAQNSIRSDASPHRFWLWAILLLIASLAVAPFVYFVWDMKQCWLPWAHSSAGVRPWAIYTRNSNCNYVPFALYLLTGAERIRLLLHAKPGGPAMVTLIKLPSILAHVGGVVACAIGLRKPLGVRAAVAAAGAYSLCVPLWFNAAVWGQFDTLLALPLLLTVIAALHRRPGWCGAAAGWALAIKLQAIMAAPAVAVFLWRRMGPAGVARASIAAAAVLIVVIAPFVAAGQGKAVKNAYFNAVGFYPRRTMTAFNTWYLMDGLDVAVRHLPADFARADDRPAIGTLTFKRLGLLLVSADLLLIAAMLYRRPTDELLPFAAAMGVFAFFMLATQMHGRYVLPAVALLAVCWNVVPPSRWVWVALAATSTLNPAVTLLRDNLRATHGHVPAGVDHLTTALAGAIAVANVLIFVGAHVVYLRAAWRAVLPTQQLHQLLTPTSPI